MNKLLSFVVIATDKPSLAMQFAQSLLSTATGQKYPTMFVMPPVEQYRSQYWFNTGELRSAVAQNYIGIIINSSDVSILWTD